MVDWVKSITDVVADLRNMAYHFREVGLEKSRENLEYEARRLEYVGEEIKKTKAKENTSDDFLLVPEWIVNDIGELGVRIGVKNFYLYKGESLQYVEDPPRWRPVGKREFGECCHRPAYSEAEYSDNDCFDWNS